MGIDRWMDGVVVAAVFFFFFLEMHSRGDVCRYRYRFISVCTLLSS